MVNVFSVKSNTDWILPKKSCLINFSLLQEIKCAAPFRSFSIKYVSNGIEKYNVNGNIYNIKSGEYLLANHFSEGIVEIDKAVKGICIDVAPDLLSETVASFMRPDTPVADILLDTFFNTPDFLENKYSVKNTNVGKFLQNLDAATSSNMQESISFNREFYYKLAECVIADQLPIYQQLQMVSGVKASTRKELFRRISTGKDFIDNYFKLPIETSAIAKECGMSEYHFYRVFKAVFGISPHQYIIQKKLFYAKKRVQHSEQSLTEIAVEAGFSDVFALSKSFKQLFGFPPSFLRRSN
ncbi:MAG: helix-turn-helix transcriptional regulator [Bacteroidetes bacterium]|nr:helix-turn-helix transcriptional regulator [Bacteroidota bacterium]